VLINRIIGFFVCLFRADLPDSLPANSQCSLSILFWLLSCFSGGGQVNSLGVDGLGHPFDGFGALKKKTLGLPVSFINFSRIP
jgi:hypothetical protein